MAKDRFSYMMLNRLKSDCEYYLGYGGRNKHSLCAHDAQAQIDKTRELYDSLTTKPQRQKTHQIDEYAARMGVK